MTIETLIEANSINRYLIPVFPRKLRIDIFHIEPHRPAAGSSNLFQHL